MLLQHSVSSGATTSATHTHTQIAKRNATIEKRVKKTMYRLDPYTRRMQNGRRAGKKMEKWNDFQVVHDTVKLYSKSFLAKTLPTKINIFSALSLSLVCPPCARSRCMSSCRANARTPRGQWKRNFALGMNSCGQFSSICTIVFVICIQRKINFSSENFRYPIRQLLANARIESDEWCHLGCVGFIWNHCLPPPIRHYARYRNKRRQIRYSCRSRTVTHTILFARESERGGETTRTKRNRDPFRIRQLKGAQWNDRVHLHTMCTEQLNACIVYSVHYTVLRTYKLVLYLYTLKLCCRRDNKNKRDEWAHNASLSANELHLFGSVEATPRVRCVTLGMVEIASTFHAWQGIVCFRCDI